MWQYGWWLVPSQFQWLFDGAGKKPSWISKLENIANQTTPNCSQKIIVFIPYAIDFNNLPEIVLSHLSITVLASFGTTVILLMFLCSTFSVYRFSFQDFSFIHHWYHPQRIPWGCDWLKRRGVIRGQGFAGKLINPSKFDIYFFHFFRFNSRLQVQLRDTLGRQPFSITQCNLSNEMLIGWRFFSMN